ncbi:macro domain-containing protein [Butyrivibrio fibrisolvens]|uniref:type II toxin-antitoxin system antitoxin DNA ADP-ribosyl glycohydrolase DarG n=1 Tax=Butyrivibrio fibrisolvens TaxID=831 RepID=UPI0003F8FEE0|nr:macro domain-containing protein [Butyrivibrio fibrisolvens]
MIMFTTGNIFESEADCLVNTVNCEGYMGKGIAYQFKLRYPENNKDYIRACKNGELQIGSLHSYTEDGKLIVNFPTKDKWREKSQMSYVQIGLDLLVLLIQEKGVKSVALPPLGCGNGGLVWDEVKAIIKEKMSRVSNVCDVIVYEPSKSYKVVAKEAPKLSVSSLALLQIKMHLNDWGFLRMQKTGFFVNYYLREDYFKFDKWKYGPYSHSIDVVAKGIKEYQDYYNLKNSDDTYKLAYQVVVSKKTEEKLQKLLPAIEKATEYVNSIEDNHNLEGVATVLYLIQNNSEMDEVKVLKLFKGWSEDKAARFSQQQILDCLNYLVETRILEKNLCGFYELNEYNH